MIDYSPALLKKLRKYGLTVEDFKLLTETQSDSCAICYVSLEYTKPHGFHIDHCYQTGAVRGLLCATCNKFLGYIEKRIDSLPTYLNYIKSPPFALGCHWTLSPIKYASHAGVPPEAKREHRLAQLRENTKKWRASKKKCCTRIRVAI